MTADDHSLGIDDERLRKTKLFNRPLDRRNPLFVFAGIVRIRLDFRQGKFFDVYHSGVSVPQRKRVPTRQSAERDDICDIGDICDAKLLLGGKGLSQEGLEKRINLDSVGMFQPYRRQEPLLDVPMNGTSRNMK